MNCDRTLTGIHVAEEATELRYSGVEDVGPITRDAVFGNWERLRKEGRLSGEWILFAVYEESNYYLCLATRVESTHESLRRQSDAMCCREFPFFAKLLINGGSRSR